MLFFYSIVFVDFRFMEVIDSVLPFLVPAWEYSIGSYSSLEVTVIMIQLLI